MENQELEVKFYVSNLASFELKLRDLQATLIQPDVLEINLRFDTPTADFSRAGQAIRLRQDTQARLTFKGPSTASGGARLRQEIEFVASNFNQARDFLLALGFQVSMIYEKYRTTYNLGLNHITLDRLPYGNFIEIEGQDADELHRITNELGLSWERRIAESYTVLFARLQTRLGLPFRDLIFDNFSGWVVTPADLGVEPADAVQDGTS